MECSLLLSMIWTWPPSLSCSFMFSTLYLRKLNVSRDCMRAADDTYVFAPDRRYQRDRAQASAAAKDVLTFFRGMKISASWNLTMFVPVSTKPSRL